jgi:hypothetical protein
MSMEQGQVLDRGRRLDCGHVVAKGRRAFPGDIRPDRLKCLGCQMRLVEARLGGRPVIDMSQAVWTVTPVGLPAEDEFCFPPGPLARFREWLGQWS